MPNYFKFKYIRQENAMFEMKKPIENIE